MGQAGPAYLDHIVSKDGMLVTYTNFQSIASHCTTYRSERRFGGHYIYDFFRKYIQGDINFTKPVTALMQKCTLCLEPSL